ncbi:hypothetical protein CRG98_044830 [Punica granatum]|uniref:Uncharacterized protein n=1 Tax=Punica granatum TaxID=22663 RepID=A0A2I0HST2_PUNGR|nr:hypothetical protein CRG98_044830 [Punica granatum]
MGLERMGKRWAFAALTWAACSSGGQLEWMIPMPPSAAMARAMEDSVTVSMGEDTQGMEREMLRVSFVERSTLSTGKPMYPGRKMTSS